MKIEEVKNLYNRSIQNNNKYEKERWFKNDLQRAGYKMTLETINKHTLNEKFESCLELGPGHGTWTNELLKSHPNSKFDLVDISKEMLNLSRKRFRDNDNIQYFESDFSEFDIDQKYDFFFSSRVIEYLPKKGLIVKKIVNLLKNQKGGFIITKTPKYLRAKLLRKKVSKFHSGQIQANKLLNFFRKNGCEVQAYPVTLSFPFLKSPSINLFLYRLFADKKLNFLSQFFSESYAIKFKKK